MAPRFLGARAPQYHDYWASEGWLYHHDSGGSSSLGPACGTRVEKCGHKGNNPCHVSGWLRSPVALQAERKLDFPGRSPQWFPRLWKGGRRRACPSLCCWGLCWTAHLDIESQKSGVSFTRNLGAGPRVPGLWSTCCLMGPMPPLRAGGCGERELTARLFPEVPLWEQHLTYGSPG